MPSGSAIDQALLDHLAADATLVGLLPDGVFYDQAPPNSKRFVVVSLVEQVDVPVFGQRGYESALYLVKAVAMSGSSADMPAAEARIDALLEDGTLTVPGYSFMAMYRERRLERRTERDDIDTSIRWFHRGGYYRVQVAVP